MRRCEDSRETNIRGIRFEVTDRIRLDEYKTSGGDCKHGNGLRVA
jgi:hypothetical protein